MLINKDNHVLKGQHSHLLNLSEGVDTIRFKLKEGKIRINHCCYTTDGGTWLDVPNGNRQTRYFLYEEVAMNKSL